MVSLTNFRNGRQQRRGNTSVLVAILMVPLLGMVALSVDVGIICTSKVELQRSADAGALAAAWELLNSQTPSSNLTPNRAEQEARNAAVEYAALNGVLPQKSITLASADIDIGHAQNPLSSLSLDYSQPAFYNVVKIRVRRDHIANNPAPSLLARILGHDSTDVAATATAAFITSVRGFRQPLDPHQKIPLLPFALDSNTWNNALAGGGLDNWRWDAAAGEFVPGSDGIAEFNLYPQNTGSMFHQGTVNLGTSQDSASHVSRQILEGVSAEDLAYHGGKLVADQQIALYLDGDAGISAGFKDELFAIRGQPRIVPIVSEMSGEGGKGVTTIVGWAGLRIADVVLVGKDKQVIAQATKIITPGAVPGGDPGTSRFITSTVWLAE